jgi:DNA-binding LytR/AlgR family response regulator
MTYLTEEVIRDAIENEHFFLNPKVIGHLFSSIDVSKCKGKPYGIFITIDREAFKILFPGEDPTDFILNPYREEPLPKKLKFTIKYASIICGGKEFPIQINN